MRHTQRALRTHIGAIPLPRGSADATWHCRDLGGAPIPSVRPPARVRSAPACCTFADVSTLAHSTVVAEGAAPACWLYVLHGIFGAGRNWASVARRVVERRPEWGAVLVDLREHGRSRGFPPPHTIAAAAGDVAALVRSTRRPATAVLGHSFGGKVALALARDHALDSGLAQLWIVDSLPAPVPEPQGDAWAMLQLLRRHPGPFADRADALAELEAEGVASGVAQWVSTNLEPGPDGTLEWRLDFDAMEALLRDFFAADLWSVVEQPPDDVRIRFVKASASRVLPPAMAERIRRIGQANGRVDLCTVAGGHWLNADNPQAMVDLLSGHL